LLGLAKRGMGACRDRFPAKTKEVKKGEFLKTEIRGGGPDNKKTTLTPVPQVGSPA